MPVPKIDEAVNDFSAGELDPDVKRSGSPLIKMGGRQMLNWRTLNSHKKTNRPGRSAQFLANGRLEEISIAGIVGFIRFAGGFLQILNSAGVQDFASAVRGDGTPIPWTQQTLGGITYAIIGKAIYIAYPDGAPNNVPQVLTFDGVNTWTLANYAETVSAGGQKRTAFYRISPQSVTLQPSATTGVVNITFSQPGILSAGGVGTRMRYANRQITIKSVTDSAHGTATVNEPLPPAQQLTPSSPAGSFNPGDVVKGSITGASGIVASGSTTMQLSFLHNILGTFHIGDAITGGTSGATGVITSNGYYAGPPFDSTYYNVQLSTSTLFQNAELVSCAATGQSATTEASGGAVGGALIVQLLAPQDGNIILFTTSDVVVGPSGSSAISAVSTQPPQAISVWDDEVMNAFRGWPSSIFADQGRLGFCNVPSVPGAIIWSALGLYADVYPDAQPGNAIFELAPDQSVVFYTIPGMESSEFVFTDRAIYYIPIGGIVGKPLEPGSVSFQKLSDYGCFPGVQPRRAEQSLIYVKAGGVQIAAVQAPGAYYRPYVVDSISEMHSHLFTASSPIAIAIPSGPTQFEELYLYVLLANGTLVVGRYTMRNGLLEPGPEGKPSVGWVPWNGGGTVSWIAARQGDMIFTSVYFGMGVVEKLDNTQFLDGALSVNNLPAAFTPPGGKGPLFNFPGPNSTVFLIDLGTRFMGTYQVDANGFLIPQFIDGENLSSSQLVAGQPWTAVFEPFMPHAQPGADNQQRMRKRKIAKGLVSVQSSSGFIFGTRRIPAYFVGEDPTQPAPLRENSYLIRPRGRSYDPRLVLTKDTPGPLIVNEYGFEVTV